MILEIVESNVKEDRAFFCVTRNLLFVRISNEMKILLINFQNLKCLLLFFILHLTIPECDEVIGQ